ncbi:MAG: PAS domain S-box protein, partial [Alphaproteobacteria bacterium]|nr:PAS domain S-box protein [Alphaproteobacteria bacterium]
GTPVRVIGTVQDITERTRAAEALKASEERFRTTFEQAGIGIAHISLGGRFLRANGKLCGITGYSLDELLALDFREIVHPDDIAEEEARLNEVAACGVGIPVALDGELDALVHRRAALEGEISALNAALATVRSSGEDAADVGLLAERDALIATIAALGQDRTSLEREVLHLKQVRADHDRVLAEHRRLRGEHEALVKAEAEARSRREAVVTEIGFAQAALETLTAQQQNLRNEVAGLRDELAAAVAERDRLAVEAERRSAGAGRAIQAVAKPRRKRIEGADVRHIPVESLGVGVVNTLGEGIGLVVTAVAVVAGWVIPSIGKRARARRLGIGKTPHA